MAKILTFISIALAGVAVAIVRPPLSSASLTCIMLLMAGGVILYHEICALEAVDVRGARPAAMRLPERTAPPAFSAPWTYPGIDRRADAIELRPTDSVEQIARTMVSSSFRQAWQKYHAEHGGPHDLPGHIVRAQKLLLTSLKKY